MSKNMYVWFIITMFGVLYRPDPGFALIIDTTEMLDVLEDSYSLDLGKLNAVSDQTTFVVTPEPVTMTLFGLGMFGLIKLKNKIR